MLSALCAGAEGCIEGLWLECERQPRCVFQIWQSRMEQGQVSQKQAALAETLAKELRRAQEQQQDAQRGITEPGEGRCSPLLAGICLGQYVAQLPRDMLAPAPVYLAAAELACWQGEPGGPG